LIYVTLPSVFFEFLVVKKALYTLWTLKNRHIKGKHSRLDEENVEAKSFLKFIELQSIPRYILIDKNLILIDQAFYHPYEPQFLTKLKDIKNHKYW
jgi:hypothetical protein